MLLQRGCTWLTLMPLLLSLSIGELSFYRDALPETSEDIALKRLARYLEAQRFQQRRSLPSTFLSRARKDHSDLQHAQQKNLEYLANKVVLESLLRQKQRAKLLTHHYRPNQYHDPNTIDQLAERDLAYLASYYNLGLKHLGFAEEKQPNEYDDDRFTKDLGYGRTFNVDKNIEEEPMIDSFHGNYANRNHAMGMDMDMFVHEGGKEAAFMRPVATTEPEFTYTFDDTNLEEEHPFAVKPNDPRYYSDVPFSSDDFNRQEETRANWKKEKETKDKERMLIQHEEDTRSVDPKTPKDLTAEFIVSEPERSAGRHPSIVPVYNNNFNNDVYFIAIVAGCSAAVMFALVLISLTWCRLQRGAKAAADIEYPAYGVTGPNKDVSPSGDQRLAQSAQMYHFQHQKQQIIAMESRTSATRDPGSLSEAESDEENEEGDYTVYECPGLASTGEMEVKNPMFHDDPTPATPAAQKDDKEDHI